jgi:sugar lactone lactonase YvrE
MKRPELYIKTDCVIGEVPIWDEASRKLYFIDIIGSNILIYHDETGELRKIPAGQNIGSIVLTEEGGIIANLVDGIYRVDESAGEKSFIANPESDIKNNRFNDGKCDPSGRMWVGTMSRTLDSGFGDYIPRGSLYCMDHDMRIEKKLEDVTISNGLAWTNDKTIFYFIDSPTQTVVAFDYDDESAAIKNRRVALDFRDVEGIPDGMCIDCEDKLWVAFFDGRAVRHCDPQSGEILETIDVPASKVTCTAFGGDDYRDLIITTGSIETDMSRYPDAGSVFKVKVDVPGPPPVRFGMRK